MKKMISVVLVCLMTAALLGGCAGSSADAVLDLGQEPMVEERVYPYSDGAVPLDFNAPAEGYMKFIAYDATEYTLAPDDICRLFVQAGEGDTIEITDGMTQAVAVKKGTNRMTFTAQAVMPTAVSLSWVYVPAGDTAAMKPDELGMLGTAVAEDGKAVFALTVEKTGLYDLFATEACTYEWDCRFRITDSNGTAVTGDVVIHGSEWSSRKVFLQPGDYTVTVEGLQAIGLCRAMQGTVYDVPVVTDAEPHTLPVTLGFNAGMEGVRTVTLPATDKDVEIAFAADGAGSYYDSVQGAEVKITGPAGVVYEEYVEDASTIAVQAHDKDYTMTVTTNDSCVVTLK